ncbi:uncharacterized protein MKZ38_005671 [Zalerion maritima]|uniref:Uncharacterized protein n=1 Tax=Zalerion maritima TaxID=339359 RepID=A0AAD5RW38_9PEZI|nr:uncharacterized protein MKZ38_005671 [Zalerion maritima]
MTVEDLLREKGQLVKKGQLGEDGDLEFWADGSITPRTARNDIPSESKPKDENAEAPPGSTFKTASSKKGDE